MVAAENKQFEETNYEDTRSGEVYKLSQILGTEMLLLTISSLHVVSENWNRAMEIMKHYWYGNSDAAHNRYITRLHHAKWNLRR